MPDDLVDLGDLPGVVAGDFLRVAALGDLALGGGLALGEVKPAMQSKIVSE